MSEAMPLVRIDCSRITDWDSFHDAFAEAFGFPDFYGRNMNAWVDCMTSLECPGDGLTKVHAPPGGVVVLQLDDVSSWSGECVEFYQAVVECSAFVNWRKLEVGEPAVLALSFHARG
jgi:Barstar (barnase inhibitor)